MGKLLDIIRGLHKPGRPFCTAVVVAAGRSERMGQDKLLLPLGNRPVLEHTLRAVNAAERVDEIILVTREDLMMPLADLCKKCGLQKPVKVVRGGETRPESVLAGALAADSRAEFIAVQDGARPLITPELFDAVAESAQITNASALYTGAGNSVRRADAPGVPGGAFKSRPAIGHYLRGEYHRRLRRCRAAGQAGAAGARRWGEYQDHPAPGPHCGGGDSEEAGGEGMTNLRIGHGYDVHRLAAGRKLILGGVDIPYEKGLEGHSDADVLVHAVMDALLGAAGLEDIGCLFPDSSEEFRGISSLVLLERVAGELKKRSVTVVNIDATILAQAPKLAPYRARMRRNIAGALGIDTEQVGVKATTEEGLGFTGDGSGMAAHAVALVERR